MQSEPIRDAIGTHQRCNRSPSEMQSEPIRDAIGAHQRCNQSQSEMQSEKSSELDLRRRMTEKARVIKGNQYQSMIINDTQWESRAISPKDDREARLRLRLLGAHHCRYIEWHQESDCAQAASSASKGKRARESEQRSVAVGSKLPVSSYRSVEALRGNQWQSESNQRAIREQSESNQRAVRGTPRHSGTTTYPRRSALIACNHR